MNICVNFISFVDINRYLEFVCKMYTCIHVNENLINHIPWYVFSVFI